MLYWDRTEDIRVVTQTLCADNVVLTSTDTVVGLLGRLSQAAFNCLNQVKKRSDKPYLILIRSADMLSYFVEISLKEKHQQLVEHCWPGPITLIFKARDDLPVYMKSSDGTIALRVPDHDGLQIVLHLFDGLFSTSANLVQQPAPQTMAEVDQAILDQVSVVCDDKTSFVNTQPSTIIDCSKDTISIVRQGAGLSETIKKLLD